MKISFDFDGVLTEAKMKALFIILDSVSKWGIHEVRHDEVLLHVITSRFNDVSYPDMDFCKDMFSFTEVHKLGGTGISKLDKIKELGIDIHFDDDTIECDEINRAECGCIAICVGYQHPETYYSNH